MDINYIFMRYDFFAFASIRELIPAAATSAAACDISAGD